MKNFKYKIKGMLFVAIAVIITSCEMQEMDEPGLLVPKTVDEDPSLPSITVNGTMLHSEAHGNPTDPMVVVLHGGPGGDYRAQLGCKDFVNDGYYVVFYDQRGCGLSQRHDDDHFTVPGYIDDLKAVIEHYRSSDDQQIMLHGHSWGGMLAAGYVNEYPDAIDGVVMAEAGGLTFDQMMDYVARQNAVNIFEEETNNAIFPQQILGGNSTHEILDYKHLCWAQMENAEGNTIGNAGTAPYWRNGAVCYRASHAYAAVHGFDFTTNLDKYNNKVLVIYSELNTAYGKDWAEEVAAPFPNVEFQIVLDAGHEMVYWGWDDMYPKVLSYLNEITNK